MIRVASLQINSRPFEVAENLEKARDWIEKAVSAGAKLVVLPEFFNLGYTYSDRLLEFSEPRDGPTVSWMKDLSAGLDIYLTGCFYEKDQDDYFDTLVITTPDRSALFYRKRHPAIWENIYFRPGDTPGVFTTGLARIGVAIFWDVVYRDTLEGLRGKVDLVLVSCAWPSLQIPGAGRLFKGVDWDLRRNAQVAPLRLAEELGVPVVFANRYGRFRSRMPFSGLRVSMPFLGQSAVVSAEGKLLKRLGMEEGMIVTEIEIPDRNEVRSNNFEKKKLRGKYIVPVPWVVRVFQGFWERFGRLIYFSRIRKNTNHQPPALGRPSISPGTNGTSPQPLPDQQKSSD
ncbi:MAG: carbon-nitrogen hydrolase family protein [bacterium]|nr:carbon-nitrogen hydrolase family protein [bacterium]